MSTVCRFAPSPTGFLHVGNIRAAIINFLYAKKTGGKFLLRLDDTDIERVKDEYRDQILSDMAWLGLHYDELHKQSDRLTRYQEAKEKLIASGRLYECYETESELNLQRKSQIASGIAPLYNRAALNLTNEQKASLRASGLKPHYRFLLEDKTTSWDDKIKGKITYEGRRFSDPVLVRDNDVPTYTFCSVVDDIDMKITDIIRGEDHVTNTAVQIQIFEALGVKAPDFSHLALVKAREGKISKRDGEKGFDMKSLRREGFEPFAIINLLAQIGASGAINVYDNFDALIKEFDLSKFSKSSTNYDISELNNINQKLLQMLDFTSAKQRLKDVGFAQEISQNLWNAVKSNIEMIADVKKWHEIFSNGYRNETMNYTTRQADQDFLNQISDLLPQDTKQENAWNIWLEEIKKITDKKGKQLFMPIRLALTGIEHGVEMKYIINLIEREEIIKRIRN